MRKSLGTTMQHPLPRNSDATRIQSASLLCAFVALSVYFQSHNRWVKFCLFLRDELFLVELTCALLTMELLTNDMRSLFPETSI